MNVTDLPEQGWIPDVARARRLHPDGDLTSPASPGDIGVINLRGAMSAVATLDPAALTGGGADILGAWAEVLQTLPGPLQLTVRRAGQPRYPHHPAERQMFLTCYEPNPSRPGGREIAATAVQGRIEQVVRLLARAAVPARTLNSTALSTLLGIPAGPAVEVDAAQGRPGGFVDGGLVEVGEVCSATISITGHRSGRSLRAGWLDGLLAFPGRLDLALHLAPASPGWLRAGVYLTVYAPTPGLLVEATAAITRHAAAAGLPVHPHRIRPVPGWVSTLPLGLDLLGVEQAIGVDALTTSLVSAPVISGVR